MRNNRQLQTTLRRMAQQAAPRWTPELIGLSPEQYAAALRYLFDRPVPMAGEDEWFWTDEPEFDATPLEWTRIQTVLFANAGTDLAAYSNEQVGMGLNYVMSNMVSDLPFAPLDKLTPSSEAIRMVEAMPALWSDYMGPRLRQPDASIGSDEDGRLGTVCYMWFDAWPTFRLAPETPAWRSAMLSVFGKLLGSSCRAVQVAALHGIGHSFSGEKCVEVDALIDPFLTMTNPADEELRTYAEAARRGAVQ